jgi:hypothetical protein
MQIASCIATRFDGSPGLDSVCLGYCDVSEGGCSTDDNCRDALNQVSLSGNDASLTTIGDQWPCQTNNVRIGGHTSSQWNGDYVEQATMLNAKHWYKNTDGDYYLYFYKSVVGTGQVSVCSGMLAT